MKYQLIAICLICRALSSMAQGDAAPDKITSSGTKHPSVCLSGKIADLRSDVEKLAGDRNPKEVGELAEVLLCKQGVWAENFALSHMPRRILSSESSGDQEGPPLKSYMAPSAKLMRKGFAWTAYATLRPPNDIKIEFWSDDDEVCLVDFTLRFISGSWLLVEVGSGCD